jgi:hypothetical protein
LRQRRGLGSGHASLGRPDEYLSVDIRRHALDDDQLATEFFETVVTETKAELNPAIGNAALGDEAPEDLFQDRAPTRSNIMARPYSCDTFSARQRSRQSHPQWSEHRADLQFGVLPRELAAERALLG